MRPTGTLNRSRQLRNSEVEIHFLFGVVLGQGHRRHCLSSLLLYSDNGEILQEWGLASQLNAHFCQGGGWIITSSKHFRLHFDGQVSSMHVHFHWEADWPVTPKAKFRRRTSHEPNRMQMKKILCSPLLVYDSAHVKYDVWTGLKVRL